VTIHFPTRTRPAALRLTALAAAIAGLCASLPADAAEPAAAGTTGTESASLPRIDVVGSTDADIARQPGAVTLVDREQIELTQPRSTEEALRQVPGVYIKPEEESAIVVNVGMRGLSAADYKTLVLEDGVPVAAGLYVGNARYYNPRMQRIEDIEVLKGAASLRYGPSTIGGVINYRTKQPEGAAIEIKGGSFGSQETLLELGGRSPSGDGIFGAVLSTAKSDGFMDKGYDMSDAMIKAGSAIGENQWVGVKFTHYENDANISYRGLFLGDYNAGADYNPAPDDWFLTGRKSMDVNHAWDITASARLETLFFWSSLYRDYWRFGTDNPASTAAGRWVYTNTVNGNNRAFERVGAETRLTLNHALFGANGEAEVGLRYMTEDMHDQTIAATRANPRTGTINQDRIDAADSLALFAQNRFALSDTLAVTPGVRVERYEQSRENLRAVAPAVPYVETSNTEVIPGVGMTWQMAPAMQVFGGLYSAFSPAQNGDALDSMTDQQLDAERSLNLEAGVRGGDASLRYEFALFRMDFDNQIIPANSSTLFQRTNGGKTFHQGIEAGVEWQVGGGFSVAANATLIPDAEFAENRYAADGVTLTTPEGNRIPYTPEVVANVALGYRTGALKTQLSLNHTGAQFTDVMNTTVIAENTSGFFTGEVDAYTTLDLSARYGISEQFEVFGSVKNLADERYIASLRQGIYAGPERSVDLGLRFKF
jgi:Fe(3+) dicitrate transport protein